MQLKQVYIYWQRLRVQGRQFLKMFMRYSIYQNCPLLAGLQIVTMEIKTLMKTETFENGFKSRDFSLKTSVLKCGYVKTDVKRT